MILYRYILLIRFSVLSLCLTSCNPFNEERTVSSEDGVFVAIMDTLKAPDSQRHVVYLKADTVSPSPIMPSPVKNIPSTAKMNIPEPVVAPVSTTASAAFVNTGKVKPAELVNFAKTLIGVRYKYASTDPEHGFDCSGFITYVFNHFKIPVPRASIDFTDVGKAVPLEMAKSGDIILFTGTNKAERYVGHMGIVVCNDNNQLEFIHSTSGKAHGVTITSFNDYYKGRFLKTIRVFAQNDL